MNRKSYLIFVGLSGLVYLLFFAESGLFSTRSWRHVWNLGHIPLFFFIGYLVYYFFPAIHRRNLMVQFLFLTIMAIVLGSGIELIQSYVGRQASVLDVVRDVFGAMASVLVFSPQIRRFRFHQKMLLVFVSVLLLLFLSRNLFTSLWDEYHAYRDFPVLADFERAAEIVRWSSSEKMIISDEVSMLGTKSLKVNITPRTYSGVELKYFPSDWSGYEQLVLNVFSPEEEPLFLVVSIFDNKHHANRFAFTDRYNKRFQLKQGWNELTVSLTDVKHAPRKREMDTTRISGLRLFVVRPRNNQLIYLDGLWLENRRVSD